MTIMSLIRKPSAWVPVVLSLGIIAMLASFLLNAYFSEQGIIRENDEGTPAHLFQIWLVLEALLIPTFAVRWLPSLPRQATKIIALQIFLVFLGCFPVFYFQL